MNVYQPVDLTYFYMTVSTGWIRRQSPEKGKQKNRKSINYFYIFIGICLINNSELKDLALKITNEIRASF